METASNQQNASTDDRSEASIGSSLLLRVRTLDPDAWQRLVHIYGPVVFRWCLRAGVRAEDAADIGQEVFRAVSNSIGRFRRERPGDTFLGWLRTITKYKITDFLRKQGTGPDAIGGTDFQLAVSQLPEQFDLESDEPVDEREESSIVFRRALEILQTEFEQRTWAAFWATAVDDRATADVADELGMTAMAVRKAKSRVLRRLRDEFDDEILGGKLS